MKFLYIIFFILYFIFNLIFYFVFLDSIQILEKGLKSPGLKSKTSKSNTAHNQSTENMGTRTNIPRELTGRDVLFLLASVLREGEVRTYLSEFKIKYYQLYLLIN